MLLTVFRKTRQHEQRQIDRAVRAQKTCERDHRGPATETYEGRCEMTGYHTRWARPQDAADDPERIAIREALAFGKALYDIRTALGLSVAELAMRASLTGDDIERIEEGGTEPTNPLLRRLAARRPPHRRTRPRLRLVRNPRRLNQAAGNTDTALVRA